MSTAPKTVGVLGGMGPAATLDFFARLLAATSAARDQDHIRLLIDCNPHLPDRNAAIAGTGPSPAPMLQEMARGLERAGADFLVMPCNAAHAFLDEVKRATKLPLISIIDVTVASLPQVQRVGVLASSGCIEARLYQKALGPQALVPEGPVGERFMQILYRIKSGDTGAEVSRAMIGVANDLVGRGAEAIIAGCTEVPLVLSAEDIPVPLVNSTDCLVRATIAAALE